MTGIDEAAIRERLTVDPGAPRTDAEVVALHESVDIGQESLPVQRQLAEEWWHAARSRPNGPDRRRAQRMASSFAIPALGTMEYWRRQAIPDPVWVYFVASPNRYGFPQSIVKVGSAKDPLARLESLQTGNPSPLCAWEVVLGSRELERHLHRRWRRLRVVGEWFDHPAHASFFIDRAHNAAVEQIRAHETGRRDPRYLTWQLPIWELTGETP